MNILCSLNVATTGKTVVSGHIEVAKEVVNPVAFREHIAYVMQEDALMPTATPREALEFSARMRLPSSTSDSDIRAQVDALLTDLGLDDCADTLIGGAMIKGISGGEKKRTSVGVELITDPALLFLDEPTSGLDSFSAFSMVQLLKSVSESNSAVLCTIHQPSSEVFFLFDILIFLKGGRVLYQGSPKDVVPHLSRLGYNCPVNYNPSDYIMFLYVHTHIHTHSD
jgi:ABC-type multidrug transport system ATPase subunit